jgi:hypothetical protein
MPLLYDEVVEAAVDNDDTMMILTTPTQELDHDKERGLLLKGKASSTIDKTKAIGVCF